MDDAGLIRETRARFPDLDPASLVFNPIVRGGSERSFYRLSDGRGWAAILIQYGPDKKENGYYAPIARFLAGLGVRVPRVLADEPALRLTWMEDLGGSDLHALASSAWPERAAAYRSVLENIFLLHQRGPSHLEANPMPLMDGFSKGVYEWEHNYFREQFLGGVCGFVPEGNEDAFLRADLQVLIDRLKQTPRALVHRDFQSQNIMMVEGRAYLIDFQGMREGSAFYDLGSLLYDPYVPFAAEERLELLRFYYDLETKPSLSWDKFQVRFHEGAAQRLMQALGAYGFLGLKRGKEVFLGHIPAGLANLREAAKAAGTLKSLENLAARCEEKTRDLPCLAAVAG